MRDHDILKTALKKMGEKKVENFQLSWQILEKKIIYQPNVKVRRKHLEKMAPNNAETAFRLTDGVNNDFISNFLWQHQQQ